jgi:hypothetical protein
VFALSVFFYEIVSGCLSEWRGEEEQDEEAIYKKKESSDVFSK